jgi:hypothetical protein
MSTNYLFAEVHLPPRKVLRPHYFFIVDNSICSFEFDGDLEKNVYKIFDDPLYTVRDDEATCTVEKIMALFKDATDKLFADGRTTVLVKHDWLMLDGLRQFAIQFDQQFASRWVFVSFFHSDADTLKLPVSDSEYAGPIDEKADCLLDLAYFPLIKKVEIPLDMVLTWDYIQDLFKEHVVW